MVSLRRSLLAVSIVAVVTALSGCAAASGINAADTRDAPSSIQKTITELKPQQRGRSITFGGTTASGSTVSSKTWRGEPVVVNFWYAGCPPCRAEAPDLASLAAQYTPQGVVFVGVNVRDEASTANEFATTFKVPYPSILDAQDGAVQLAFAGEIAPNAVPTTLVLDREGRVASRIIGQIPDKSILQTLIDDVLKEGNRG